MNSGSQQGRRVSQRVLVGRSTTPVGGTPMGMSRCQQHITTAGARSQGRELTQPLRRHNML